MPDIYKQVGDKIRSLRHQKCLSQEAFALKAGLHRSHVGEIERGESNVCLRTLEIICSSLNVPLEQLFIGIGMPRPKTKRSRRPAKPGKPH
jgi:transcriptional regulator with XRE-family HTH domain